MKQNNKISVGEIFRKYGPLYRKAFEGRIPAHHLKVMNAIEICRTSALGSHVYKCDNCEKLHFAYESCGNRHCPQCQSLKAEQWVFEKKKDLLPVQYFHVVFRNKKLKFPGKISSLHLKHNFQKLIDDLFKFTENIQGLEKVIRLCYE